MYWAARYSRSARWGLLSARLNCMQPAVFDAGSEVYSCVMQGHGLHRGERSWNGLVLCARKWAEMPQLLISVQ